MAKKEINQSAVCPLRHLNAVFGGKWKMPILCILASGEEPKRYSAIKRHLGDITNVMLSQSLHELEAAGWAIENMKASSVVPFCEQCASMK